MNYLNIILVTLFFSANADAQKRKVFNTLPAYISHVKDDGIDEDKLIVLNSADNAALGEDIGRLGFYTFYGVVYNSQLISAGKLERKSCWGQFRNLCAEIDSTSSGVDIENISYLKKIPFDKSKKTIVFLYSYKIGKGHVKRYIQPILDGVKNDDTFDYMILSLDAPDIQMVE